MVKASVKLENFVAARWTLGGVFHTLQVRLTIIVTDFCGDGGVILEVTSMIIITDKGVVLNNVSYSVY